MREPEKYCGVIPAFYACYDDAGEVSPERVRALAEHLIRKGVKGVYVGGSSGECIYQSVDDRKRTLENVMAVAKGRSRSSHTWRATTRGTAWNWRAMPRAWE